MVGVFVDYRDNTTKPDWKDAPEWARFLARDCDGTWTFFMLKPELNDWEGCWRADIDNRLKLASMEKLWYETLEEKPD